MNDTDTESGLVFLKLTIPEPRLGLEPLKVRDFNETRPRREVSEYPGMHADEDQRIDPHGASLIAHALALYRSHEVETDVGPRLLFEHNSLARQIPDSLFFHLGLVSSAGHAGSAD